jgi:hypothetical protein
MAALNFAFNSQTSADPALLFSLFGKNAWSQTELTLGRGSQRIPHQMSANLGIPGSNLVI